MTAALKMAQTGAHAGGRDNPEVAENELLSALAAAERRLALAQGKLDSANGLVAKARAARFSAVSGQGRGC